MTGFTAGTFDLLHAGHVSFFRQCRKQCDRLIVAIEVNPNSDRPYKNKPIQTVVEREIQVMGCRYVDQVIFYESERDLINLLAVIDIEKRFIGGDWQGKEITGERLCEKRNIQIIYIPRDHEWSTTELRERIKS